MMKLKRGECMEITSEAVLSKAEELIQRAKQTKGEEQKGYIIAAKSLMELLLSTETKKVAAPVQVSHLPIVQQPITQQGTVTLPNEQPVRLDDANGDSLFDF